MDLLKLKQEKETSSSINNGSYCCGKTWLIIYSVSWFSCKPQQMLQDSVTLIKLDTVMFCTDFWFNLYHGFRQKTTIYHNRESKTGIYDNIIFWNKERAVKFLNSQFMFFNAASPTIIKF